MKLPIGTKAHLLGCDKNSPAYNVGIRLEDVGVVVGHHGQLNCCKTPEDCSLLQFIKLCPHNEAHGYQKYNLCVQDVHMRRAYLS